MKSSNVDYLMLSSQEQKEREVETLLLSNYASTIRLHRLSVHIEDLSTNDIKKSTTTGFQKGEA